MRVTLNDIAVRYGVTKAAVSMAMRNSPQISRVRREEIQKLAKEMGYVQDPFLAALAKYRFKNNLVKARGRIAWLNHWQPPEILRSYKEFDDYFYAARKAGKPLGYQLEEFIWPEQASPKYVEKKLRDRGILGLLIPPHPPGVDWGDFGWNAFSLIRFGMSVNRPDSNLVTADHQRAIMMAVRKIHGYGYQRIGFVFNYVHDCSMGGNYTGGYRWAQEFLKVRPLIPSMDFDIQPLPPTRNGYEHCKTALEIWIKKYKPDAVLTSIPEVPALLSGLGFRIPEDVAVAGTSIHDIPVDAGIDQHPGAIGQIAMEMLIKQISLNERGEPNDPCRILVESRWQDGKSLPSRV